jgi:hypothetical protein
LIQINDRGTAVALTHIDTVKQAPAKVLWIRVL